MVPMPDKTYDVAIIGAGVCGASIARALSAFDLDVVLLEKCGDVGFGVSKANSGIIHAGFHHKPDTLKARLEIIGNRMFDRLHKELKFPFRRPGILVVAFSEEDMKTVQHLYRQGLQNEVEGLEICGASRIHQLEPKINHDALGGLLALSGGIIEPYRFVFSLVESACKNGVVLKTGFNTVSANRENDVWSISSSENETIRAVYAVNAAGLYADAVSSMFSAEKFEIIARKGEEYLLDRNADAYPNHVLFPTPAANSKGILVIPTVEGTTMVGPTAEDVEDRDDVATTGVNLENVFAHARHLMPSISRRDIITSFAGTRPALANGDFFIAMSKLAPQLVQVAGIQSPGLTASPAIAEYVTDLLKKDGLCFNPRQNYYPDIKELETVRGKDGDALSRLAEQNPGYGNIVCRCENVSEAEIVEAIHKGHTTLDGIKFYTRSGMGRCQGGFCTYKILKILERETGKPVSSFTKRGGKSRIVESSLFDNAKTIPGNIS